MSRSSEAVDEHPRIRRCRKSFQFAAEMIHNTTGELPELDSTVIRMHGTIAAVPLMVALAQLAEDVVTAADGGGVLITMVIIIERPATRKTTVMRTRFGNNKL